MSMLETHKNALNSHTTVYHEFLLLYKSNEKFVYGFVEGKEDPTFYRTIIDGSLPDGWEVELLKCGSKSKVLEVMEHFDWTRFPATRICFYVDRDLSDFLGEHPPVHGNVYVTDNYAIENEVCKWQVLKRVLEEILNVTESNANEKELIKEKFEENLTTFRDAIVPVMAQILIWKRSGQNPSLDNISVKDYFEFQNGHISLKAEFNTTEARIAHAGIGVGLPHSSLDEVASIEAEFRKKKGHEKFIRGKYVLWFFVQCARELHKAIHQFCTKHKTPPKVKATLGYNGAMVHLGPRVRVPTTLRAFLKNNYGEYIKNFEH